MGTNGAALKDNARSLHPASQRNLCTKLEGKGNVNTHTHTRTCEYVLPFPHTHIKG